MRLLSPWRILMIRRCASILGSSLLLGLLFAGCQSQKPADQQAGGDANANSSPSMAESVKKALEPKPLVVPADAVIAVVLDQTISSKVNHPGDRFSATVESPVEVEGKVVIPKGARADGIVK